MSDIDYTEIRNGHIRIKIRDLLSEMLDNPDENGIYPTSKFMWEMEAYILPLYELLRKYSDAYEDTFDLGFGMSFAEEVRQALAKVEGKSNEENR